MYIEVQGDWAGGWKRDLRALQLEMGFEYIKRMLARHRNEPYNRRRAEEERSRDPRV